MKYLLRHIIAPVMGSGGKEHEKGQDGNVKNRYVHLNVFKMR